MTRSYTVPDPDCHGVVVRRGPEFHLRLKGRGERVDRRTVDEMPLLASSRSVLAAHAAARLFFGEDGWQEIRCLTPTGMIGCHGMRLHSTTSKQLVCAFCGWP